MQSRASCAEPSSAKSELSSASNAHFSLNLPKRKSCPFIAACPKPGIRDFFLWTMRTG